MRVFSSEQAIIDYVESENYDTPSGTPFSDSVSDDEGREDISGQQREGGIEVEGGQSRGPRARPRQERRSKVGMAVIFNKAPLEGEVPQWDYTLRLNYTYGVSQFEEQVSYSSSTIRCKVEHGAVVEFSLMMCFPSNRALKQS